MIKDFIHTSYMLKQCDEIIETKVFKQKTKEKQHYAA